jgi:hypothetical protein
VAIIGDHVVHQSYIVHVKALVGGIFWLLNSDTKVYEPTPGAWQGVDLSTDSDIPHGTSGIVLEIVNESSTNDYIGQVRATGSSGNRASGAEVKRASQTSADASVAFVSINSDYPAATARKSDIRANGSSDDQYSYAQHLGNLQSNIFYLIGLDNSQVFETKIESNNIEIHVLGYQE